MKIENLRKLSDDERGVLGLPLNLLIMVVIAAVAIGIILTWMFVITPPLDHIEVTPTMVKNVGTVNSTFDVKVAAYNDKGTMAGCEVSLEGAGVDMKAITDSNGEYTFVGVKPVLPPNTNSDFITVTVSGGGNTLTQSIAVNK
ncbi:MAG: hypothetical protein L0213_00545 [Candidatus Dadabacteria bacterium]|nr:hypothetical protein [Candidatus Dadabacteria bacterium]